MQIHQYLVHRAVGTLEVLQPWLLGEQYSDCTALCNPLLLIPGTRSHRTCRRTAPTTQAPAALGHLFIRIGRGCRRCLQPAAHGAHAAAPPLLPGTASWARPPTARPLLAWQQGPPPSSAQQCAGEPMTSGTTQGRGCCIREPAACWCQTSRHAAPAQFQSPAVHQRRRWLGRRGTTPPPCRVWACPKAQSCSEDCMYALLAERCDDTDSVVWRCTH